jgi:hypothetical protein
MGPMPFSPRGMPPKVNYISFIDRERTLNNEL